MDLTKIIVPIKEAEFEYPAFTGVNITLCFLTRDELLKLRKKATTPKFSRKSGKVEDDMDSDIFQDLYIKAVIVGWEGFKYKYVAKLLPLDLKGVNIDDELEYSPENAIALMKNSTDFDSWVSNQLEDLENFTDKSQDD